MSTSGGTISGTTPITPTITPVSSSNHALTTTTQTSQPVANKAANLRSGPGTNYAVVGNVKVGQALVISGRNEAGDWYQLADGAWIAAFLVNGAPAISAITIAQAIPPPPTAVPAPAAPAEQNQSAPVQANPSIVGIGQDLHGRGWRFKVSEIHKRKAVYFYDDAYVAMGYFLVVIIDGVNEQSGTDYFDRQIDPYLTDDPGNAYQQSPTGTVYAAWQYNGIATTVTHVNPGNFVRIAMVFDLPPATGRVMLSTDLPGWIDLGNFSSMKVEDQ